MPLSNPLRTYLAAAVVVAAGTCQSTRGEAPRESARDEVATPANRVEPPAAPNMVLLYYGFDARGARNWTPELLRHYVARHENRGTAAERPVDVFFDTVLWMYRRSSRGHLFEAGRGAKPTMRLDWEECLDRLFIAGQQLEALEETAAGIERDLERPVKLRVILTLPYPDVRVESWAESVEGPDWDFRSSDEPRLEAVRWYIDQTLARWKQADFNHLQLLGFYWFNESHINLRPKEEFEDPQLLSDVGLIRRVARHVHSLKADGRPLTLTWIPYSPYGHERLGVVKELLHEGERAERMDYLMVQPNYFFPRWNKTRDDLVNLVRSAASVPAGVEVEFDESLVRDATARQRLMDYLEVIPAEHPEWPRQPAGYYQGVRAVHEMATRPELADLYDALFRFVAARRSEHKASADPAGVRDAPPR